MNDLQPVALLPSNPMLVVSKKAVPELIAWVKSHRGTVSVGTAGPGSGTHVAGMYFQRLTNTQLTFVPYRGTGPAMQDLMSGQIDLIVDQAANSLPQVRSGKIKAYAVTAKQRLATAPEIPTVDEGGLQGLYVSTWYGLWAPKNTPRTVIERLSAAAMEALADPAVRRRYADLGLEIPSRDQQTPEAMGAFHKAEIERWWPIVRAANLKGE